MTLRRRLLVPLAVMLAFVQWVALGLVVHLERVLAFALLAPILPQDRVGWGCLAAAQALAVVDVVLDLRRPDDHATPGSSPGGFCGCPMDPGRVPRRWADASRTAGGPARMRWWGPPAQATSFNRL